MLQAGHNGLHFEWSPGVPIDDEQQPHIDDVDPVLPPPPHEDIGEDDDDDISSDGDEDDNIPDLQRDPVTDDDSSDSDDSAGPFHNEDDAPQHRSKTSTEATSARNSTMSNSLTKTCQTKNQSRQPEAVTTLLRWASSKGPRLDGTV
jgi:hypothetical protein